MHRRLIGLIGTIQLLVALAGQLPTASVQAPRLSHGEEARAYHTLQNAERVRHGLKSLRVNAQLFQAALAQSNWQAARDKIGHDGRDGSDPFTRIKRYAPEMAEVQENVASGPQIEAAWALELWMGSTVGHRDNVLGNWDYSACCRRTGASGRDYWTAVYGRAR